MSIVCVCGDSFFATDKDHRGQHWSEQLSNHEVYNLARVGSSNFSIWHQVMQTKLFKPDLVLISFTNCPRIEYLSQYYNIGHIPLPSTVTQDRKDRMKIFFDIKTKFSNEFNHASPNANTEIFDKWARLYYIEPFEILKNFMYISSALDSLQNAGVAYRATLGGFEHYSNKHIDNVKVDFSKWQEFLDLPNGWQFPGRHKSSISFHIDDEAWHADHADVVLKLLS